MMATWREMATEAPFIPALKPVPIKAFGVVTLVWAKVTPELRKRMVVGHLLASLCR